MLTGLPDDIKEELHLQPKAVWSIASNSDCNENDAERFRKTAEALEQLQLGDSAKYLWKLLASLLHLGNVDFYMEDDQWKTSFPESLMFASELLGVGQKQLWTIISIRQLQAGSNVVVRPCANSSECASRRDTLLKLLYRLAFDSILKGVNQKLHKSHQSVKDCKYLCTLCG